MKGSKLQVKYACIIDSPIGKLGIVAVNRELAAVDFLPATTPVVQPKTLKIAHIVTKLTRYFYSRPFQFNLCCHLAGTLGQQKIWRALQQIPVGHTITYGALARNLNTSPRVIGNACRRNPLPIIIPCHRVVAATSLGGYSGKSKKMLKIKQWLLNHEAINS